MDQEREKFHIEKNFRNCLKGHQSKWNIAHRVLQETDRLRRRIENYRRRQSDCVPRFEQTFSSVCEQQNHETSVLQKRYLESKAKRAAKKTEKKQSDSMLANNLPNSVHVVSSFFLVFYF